MPKRECRRSHSIPDRQDDDRCSQNHEETAKVDVVSWHAPNYRVLLLVVVSSREYSVRSIISRIL
jgi:hypothetical protein